MLSVLCGEGGIRTPGTLPFNSFQDCRNRPLYHLSNISINFFQFCPSVSAGSNQTGIRTLGTVTRSPHFECGPIDHSGISPGTFAPTGCKYSEKRGVKQVLVSPVYHMLGISD